MTELSGISQKPAWLSIAMILITVFLGFVVIGPLLGFLLAMPFMEGSLFDFAEQLTNPAENPQLRTPLIIMQGCATLFGLIVIPYFYLYGSEKTDALQWVKNKKTPLAMVAVTLLIVISFMAPDSIIIEWNANFVFPDFLKEFGVWAKANEQKAEALTKVFTAFTSPIDFLIGVFVIAFLPAIGEELVFRGMLQPEINRLTGNKHIAIWTSAIIFSAFHMQFFGFLPRMFLGVLFGYLYVWSGNLLFPILAHFFNNGLLVLVMYLYQLGIVTEDLETPKAMPWPAVTILTAVFIISLYYFKKYHTTQNQLV